MILDASTNPSFIQINLSDRSVDVLQGASSLVDLDAQLGLQVPVHRIQIVNTLHTPFDNLLLCVFDALPDAHCVQIAGPPLHNVKEELVCCLLQFGLLCPSKSWQVDG